MDSQLAKQCRVNNCSYPGVSTLWVTGQPDDIFQNDYPLTLSRVICHQFPAKDGKRQKGKRKRNSYLNAG